MKKYPKGLSLLLMLFVLSALLVVGLSAGAIILRQLKISSTSDRGIRAFYAAESGVEEALYLFRQLGETDLTIDISNAIDIGDARWWRESTQSITTLNTTLSENQVTELVLFDPNSSSNKATSVIISWSDEPTVCPLADHTWIEAVQSYWTGTGTDSERSLISPSESGGATVPIVGDFPSIRLRALYGSACSLVVEAFDSNGPFNIPTQMVVKATGEMIDARQTLSVTVPVRAAQFGAFDYTIFSEQSICKDVAVCN